VSLSSLAFIPAAEAVPVMYNVSGTFSTFDQDLNELPAGSFSGSFGVEEIASVFSYSNISITTSADGVFPGATYTTGFGDATSLTMSITNSSPNNSTFSLLFSLTGPAPFVLSGSEQANDLFDVRNVSSGFATPQAVPLETDAIPVVVSGLLFAGGFWLKRKRNQAKVSELIATNN
jgi:hypothetical protein